MHTNCPISVKIEANKKPNKTLADSQYTVKMQKSQSDIFSSSPYIDLFILVIMRPVAKEHVQGAAKKFDDEKCSLFNTPEYFFAEFFVIRITRTNFVKFC